MKISLITVCYNAERTLPDAIESVLSQRGADVEYIVVDGGSSDGSVDIIRSFEPKFAALPRDARISYRWLSEPDQGMYDALNKGIRMASGDIVGILNSDDMFEDASTLADIAAAFDDSVDALYADIRFVEGDRTVRYYSAGHWRPWMHNWGYMPPHPSVYIRRTIFDRLGLYKLGYRISADFELMVRFFCRNRIRTKYLPRCVVKMRPGGLSTAGIKSKLRLNRENVRANRENGYFSCFAMMLPKYAYKILGVIFPHR